MNTFDKRAYRKIFNRRIRDRQARGRQLDINTHRFGWKKGRTEKEGGGFSHYIKNEGGCYCDSCWERNNA